MPVRLDRLPGPAQRPAPPRLRRWLYIFPCFLLVGIIAIVASGEDYFNKQPAMFWCIALGVPSLSWSLLAGGRWLLYASQHLLADSWDDRRWRDVARQTQCGRRSLQILSISLHTAFVEEENPDSQLSALMQHEIAFRSQRSWQGKEAVRHSRLPLSEEESSENAEEITQRQLLSMFTAFAGTLASLPDDMPLQLVIEPETSLSGEALHQIWQEAWKEAGILQPVSRIEGTGLSVIDNWLDHHIHESALLVVVALQIHPAQPDMTAESAVGLIFGNRLTQKSLLPLAYLHRPELAPESTLESGVRQALDWVPLSPGVPGHVWLSGISPKSGPAVATVMAGDAFNLSPGQGAYDLDSSLGHPGCVTSWLVIAAAAQAARFTDSPQFTFSGASLPEQGVWSAVVTPYLTPQEMTQ